MTSLGPSAVVSSFDVASDFGIVPASFSYAEPCINVSVASAPASPTSSSPSPSASPPSPACAMEETEMKESSSPSSSSAPSNPPPNSPTSACASAASHSSAGSSPIRRHRSRGAATEEANLSREINFLWQLQVDKPWSLRSLERMENVEEAGLQQVGKTSKEDEEQPVEVDQEMRDDETDSAAAAEIRWLPPFDSKRLRLSESALCPGGVVPEAPVLFDLPSPPKRRKKPTAETEGGGGDNALGRALALGAARVAFGLLEEPVVEKARAFLAANPEHSIVKERPELVNTTMSLCRTLEMVRAAEERTGGYDRIRKGFSR